jgi:predicted amidophosphoribosyltransferase
MALIKCPECGKEISDLAKACPSCGCPVNSDSVDETESVRIVQTRGLGT